MPKITIYHDDNLNVLKQMPSESVDMIYIDPPYNTGKIQQRTQIKTILDEQGDRIGFKNQRYKTIKIGTKGYNDKFDDFLGFLNPRMEEAYRILKKNGSLFFHLDYREIHYCKIMLDNIFDKKSFINEIIWAYDYGARSKKNGPPNMIISSGMPKTLIIIHLTMKKWTESLTWLLVL